MLALSVIRATLRILPTPLRERWAAHLFMTQRRHDEPAREQALRDDGVEMSLDGHAALAFGPDDGPVAVLLHGWEGRGLQLGAFIGPLVERGHRVIAIDGPNHGRSPAGVPGIPTFAALLEHAIAQWDPQVIIAHSMGAGAAVVAAARTGFNGRLLCLGGPPETHEIFTRARAFMGLPESGRDRFYTYLMAHYEGFRLDDVTDIEARAREWGGRVHAVLAADDDDIPASESTRIVEAAGGEATVLDDVTHRSVMWKPHAVEAGMAWLDRSK